MRIFKITFLNYWIGKKELLGLKNCENKFVQTKK